MTGLWQFAWRPPVCRIVGRTLVCPQPEGLAPYSLLRDNHRAFEGEELYLWFRFSGRVAYPNMYIRNMSLLTLTLLAVAISTSCGEKKEDPGVPIAEKRPAPPPLTPGISQTLTRSDKPLMYRFDRLGSVANPLTQKNIQIPGDSSALIMGWAVDDTAKKLSGGVDVVIDQTTYSARPSNRTDVAAYYKQPDLAMAGFELLVPPGLLTKGDHTLSIRVISSDKKSYYQGDVVKFAVN